jgi:SAM-dependent methyltransferase
VKISQWNKVAIQYARVRDTRRETVFPLIWQRIRYWQVKTLLDYGGGDGSFAALRPHAFPIEITIYEPCDPLRRIAARNLAREKRIHLTGEAKFFKSKKFDAVTLNAVWMSLATRRDCLALLKKIHRLLRPQGVLIASVTHPCFRNVDFATFRTSFNNEWYCQSGRTFQVVISDGTNAVSLEDTHWALSDIFNQLTDAGFRVQRMWEVPDIARNGKRRPGVPWLVLECPKSKS